MHEEHHHAFLVRLKDSLRDLLVIVIVVVHLLSLQFQGLLSLLAERVELELVQDLVGLLLFFLGQVWLNLDATESDTVRCCCTLRTFWIFACSEG